MKLLVTLDFRFTWTPDGQIWTRKSYSLPFWDRYLKVFDGVKVVARAEHKSAVDHRYRPVVGPGVEFIEVPYYLGPGNKAKVGGENCPPLDEPHPPAQLPDDNDDQRQSCEGHCQQCADAQHTDLG